MLPGQRVPAVPDTSASSSCNTSSLAAYHLASLRSGGTAAIGALFRALPGLTGPRGSVITGVTPRLIGPGRKRSRVRPGPADRLAGRCLKASLETGDLA
jgi:hypothetical protein